MSGDVVRRLNSLLAPVVAASGLLLEGVAVRSVGKRRVVVVTVDLPDGPGGVGSDALADVSRAVSAALDADDTFSSPYVLEVSTPGVSRPLREPRHYRRATGRLVRLRTRSGGTVTGRVASADEEGVTLDPSTPAGGSRRFAFEDIVGGAVEVELRGVDEPDSGEG